MIYIVKSGDSLSLIAQRVTGDLENWRTIASVNAILNPNTIYPGQQIIIPDSMVKSKPTSIEIIGGAQAANGEGTRSNRDLLPLLAALAVGGILMLFTSKGRPKRPRKLRGPGYGKGR